MINVNLLSIIDFHVGEIRDLFSKHNNTVTVYSHVEDDHLVLKISGYYHVYYENVITNDIKVNLESAIIALQGLKFMIPRFYQPLLLIRKYYNSLLIMEDLVLSSMIY